MQPAESNARRKNIKAEPRIVIRATILPAVACLLSLSADVGMAAQPTQFDFGVGGNADGVNYATARGYGFELDSESELGPRFSIKLPEGNYRITLRFGDRKRASRTTIAAETRRLMLQDVTTAPGQFVERSFIVNVRTPALARPPPNAPGGDRVRLNTRELDGYTWDDKLTLQFIGASAAVAGLSVAVADTPTLYLAGDSTVTDQRDSPTASWGQILPRFFSDRIGVANHAESGETLKSFLAGLRLDKVLANLREGDWLLIQFGHNDQKAQWPQTYAEAGTTYRSYLRAYIAEARRRGATPILVSSPERGNLDASGRIAPTHGEYPDAVRALAREEAVALIDLCAMSTSFYERLGAERIGAAFADGGKDRTHHSNYGAYELARLVVSGIRATDPQLSAYLADALKPEASTIPFRYPDEAAAFAAHSL